jgi:hypothetical protein
MKTAVRVALACAALTAALLACGPWFTQLDPVTVTAPAFPAAYDRGELGVVRPRFARRYLVQAYRVLTGRGPLPPAAKGADSLYDAWIAARDRILGPPPPGGPPQGMWATASGRSFGKYEVIVNCPEEAFRTAVKTLKAREAQFGGGSRDLVEWTRAQAAVFLNCGDSPLTLPEATSSGSALVRADRAYQTAAAYFYGGQYEEAARRFGAIAGDAASPWRPYGRYLAARAFIRMATVPEHDQPETDRLLGAAETELNAVLANPAWIDAHGPARRMMHLVSGRLHPIDRLHEVSRALSSPAATDDDLTDYRLLMDRMLGDTVDYPYAKIPDRGALIQDDDLTDWILAVQGQGTAVDATTVQNDGVARAIERWQQTRAPHWLVAVLWNLPANHASAPAALDAAQRIERTSPAYPTVAFLRVRLLAQMGRIDDARGLLATLPAKPEAGFQAETINLLNAERLMLARSLDEFLANAPRTIVVDVPYVFDKQPAGSPRVTFDTDSEWVFNFRLPLSRLVEASSSARLPDRLRLHVAIAAFTRAVLLDRPDEARKAAVTLRALAPPARDDVDRYLAATASDREPAALLMLLRTPGLRIEVRGIDDDASYETVAPIRSFDHLTQQTWWCGRSLEHPDSPNAAASPSTSLLYTVPTPRIPFPSFVTDAERTTADQERLALMAIGDARDYIAAQTLEWAKARPADPNVPEALARVIDGWRWNCGSDDKWPMARDAFNLLHRRYPQSDWTKRTKYWYR